MNRPLLGGVNHGEKWELAEIVIAVQIRLTPCSRINTAVCRS